MKKTFFGLFILSFILSIVVAIEFSVEYGHYFVGGNYDKEDPESAWIWIDTTGDYNPNYIFWFPNPEPFAQNNPEWLDYVKQAKENHEDIRIEFVAQIWNGEVRYIITDIEVI
jgi:hypothetical protein